MLDIANLSILSDLVTKAGSTVVDNMSTENLEEIKPRQQQKAKTKVAKAKALLRKGIKTNTRLVFDEEGNVGVVGALHKLYFNSEQFHRFWDPSSIRLVVMIPLIKL